MNYQETTRIHSIHQENIAAETQIGEVTKDELLQLLNEKVVLALNLVNKALLRGYGKIDIVPSTLTVVLRWTSCQADNTQLQQLISVETGSRGELTIRFGQYTDFVSFYGDSFNANARLHLYTKTEPLVRILTGYCGQYIKAGRTGVPSWDNSMENLVGYQTQATQSIEDTSPTRPLETKDIVTQELATV